ncbi:VWA domain-containing protein [Vibrio parahaemolyticus]|nr:VWA domain-containing protein [Vibrio parahaemolyticus]
MSDLKKFQVQSARPLPIIVMADTSGSMSVDGKVEALNKALKDMISAFASESRLRAELQVSVVTFGGIAEVHLPLTPAYQIEAIKPLPASGGTPLGEACKLVANLIEDKEQIPSRAYKPVIVLVSDGHPTDDFSGLFSLFYMVNVLPRQLALLWGLGLMQIYLFWVILPMIWKLLYLRLKMHVIFIVSSKL